MKEIPQLQNKTTKFSCNNNSSQLQIINNYMFDKLFTDYLTLASMVLLNEINVSIKTFHLCVVLWGILRAPYRMDLPDVDTLYTLRDGPT